MPAKFTAVPCFFFVCVFFLGGSFGKQISFQTPVRARTPRRQITTPSTTTRWWEPGWWGSSSWKFWWNEDLMDKNRTRCSLYIICIMYICLGYIHIHIHVGFPTLPPEFSICFEDLNISLNSNLFNDRKVPEHILSPWSPCQKNCYRYRFLDKPLNGGLAQGIPPVSALGRGIGILFVCPDKWSETEMPPKMKTRKPPKLPLVKAPDSLDPKFPVSSEPFWRWMIDKRSTPCQKKKHPTSSTRHEGKKRWGTFGSFGFMACWFPLRQTGFVQQKPLRWHNNMPFLEGKVAFQANHSELAVFVFWCLGFPLLFRNSFLPQVVMEKWVDVRSKKARFSRVACFLRIIWLNRINPKPQKIMNMAIFQLKSWRNSPTKRLSGNLFDINFFPTAKSRNRGNFVQKTDGLIAVFFCSLCSVLLVFRFLSF